MQVLYPGQACVAGSILGMLDKVLVVELLAGSFLGMRDIVLVVELLIANREAVRNTSKSSSPFSLQLRCCLLAAPSLNFCSEYLEKQYHQLRRSSRSIWNLEMLVFYFVLQDLQFNFK